MKLKSVVLVLFLSISLGTYVFAQEKPEEQPKYGWQKEMVGGINLTQTSLSNWTQGGENSLAWQLNFNFKFIITRKNLIGLTPVSLPTVQLRSVIRNSASPSMRLNWKASLHISLENKLILTLPVLLKLNLDQVTITVRSQKRKYRLLWIRDIFEKVLVSAINQTIS